MFEKFMGCESYTRLLYFIQRYREGDSFISASDIVHAIEEAYRSYNLTGEQFDKLVRMLN